MSKAIKSITYKMFGEWAIALVMGEEIEGYSDEVFIDKAKKLIAREDKKQTYSQSRAKQESKASEETKSNAELIRSVLSATPMTNAEISEAAGKEFTSLQISTAIQYLQRTTAVEKTRKPEQVERIKNGVKCTDTAVRVAYYIPEDAETEE